MSVQHVPARYKTSDGREFSDMASAEKHEALLKAQREYMNARSQYTKLLFEGQKTADGKPFEFSVLRDYYYISPFCGIPNISTIDFYLYDCHVSENDGCVVIRKGDTFYEVSSLYATREAAEDALAEEKQKLIVQLQADVEKHKAKRQRG